jgi:O-acetylserine/cysteine efflux transporter
MAIRDVLALVVVAIIWGLSFVVIKIGLSNFPPLFFLALRFGVVTLAIFFVPRPKVEFRHIILIGISLGVVKFSLLYSGIDVGVGAGMSSVVLQSQVFFTIILYLIVYGEKPDFNQIVGMVFGMTGLAVIFFDLHRSASAIGFSLVLAAGLAWSTANVLMRKAGKTEPFALIVWISAVAAGPLLIGSLIIEGKEAVATALLHLTLQGVFVIVYIAFPATLFAFAVWGKMLARYPASAVAPFALLVPVVGMVSGVLFLGESVSPTSGLGAALILTGLMVGAFVRKSGAFDTRPVEETAVVVPEHWG